MQKEEGDRIIRVMRIVCKEQNEQDQFATLEKIYGHISKHDNESSDIRARNIKDIIDSTWKGGD